MRSKKPSFTCTPEQEKAAVRFVQLTIAAQRIIGPAISGHGDVDILGQIHSEYHETLAQLLRKEKRLEWLGENTPRPRAMLVLTEGEPAFALRFSEITANGDWPDQVRMYEFLYSESSGPRQVGYKAHIQRGRTTIRVYFKVDSTQGRLNARVNLQIIDVKDTGFECPLCRDVVDELFVDDLRWHFACVPCMTILSPSDRVMYERARRARKGGAQ